ncbi:SDR family oxidoreductase [Rhizobium sp. EC-SD404]|uniref:SDR family oxidoreductase n=1 Tax=Rhizobium sp. EC-SD404 TaxID=2038389 RepID=UPI0012527396|nr:SDR family oxidoreductase [Rhizobium sp. EC-SD404]VVT26986.1 NAD-dependent nucleoside-diphosphate-sugar epimerase protein [Rhizobium sp. EC-SD404]
MRIFVTGATGFIGSAIVQELLAYGHTVLGLARSDASEEKLQAAGAEALRGDLQDLDALRKGAETSDAVIHAGFVHDFSRFAEACTIDRVAIETLGAAIAQTGKPMIVTAGVAFLNSADAVTVEMDQAFPPTDIYPRASEQTARALTERGIPVGVVRLPPSVHGEGDHAFVPMLIDMARRTGRSAYIDEGTNAWSAVHVKDAAACFRLAIEQSQTSETWHAVTEEAIPFRHIAELIGERLNLPSVSLSPAEAQQHFDWFFPFASIDQPTSSEITRRKLGWQPIEPDLLTDMRHAGYFEAS